MKTFLPYITIFLLAGIAFIGVMEMNDRNRLQQAEIEGLKRENQIKADSLNKALLLTRDSLEIALHTIAVNHKETLEARERSQATIKALQKIIFIVHNDSSRTATLKELYKSYK